MEETLGKRISANRKRLGLTQDQLAERLGVTAQAVSKWENDQSCPDIGTLPRLADIFDISVDELLGSQPREKKKVLEAEVTEPEDGRENVQIHVGSGRKGLLGFAVWLLAAGGLLLANPYAPWENLDVWTVLWTTGLLVFGIFGIYPRFSVFRLGCAVLGGMCLGSQMFLPEFRLTWPVLLLVMGILLLIEALRGKRDRSITVPVAGHVNTRTTCDIGQERFDCSASFGEKEYRIDCRRLTGGRAELAFGEMTLDLTRCAEIAEDCRLELKASFGEMKVLVPRTCRVHSDIRTSFAACAAKGEPGPDAGTTIYITGGVSFGELEIRYL